MELRDLRAQESAGGKDMRDLRCRERAQAQAEDRELREQEGGAQPQRFHPTLAEMTPSGALIYAWKKRK